MRTPIDIQDSADWCARSIRKYVCALQQDSRCDAVETLPFEMLAEAFEDLVQKRGGYRQRLRAAAMVILDSVKWRG